MTTPYIQAFTSNHIPIWIGKNARSNDILTFQCAHPKDLWFHTKDVPGAHVILHTKGLLTPALSDIQEASDYARRHSSYAKNPSLLDIGSTPVHCVEVCQLTKSKYDKPGQVRIHPPK